MGKRHLGLPFLQKLAHFSTVCIAKWQWVCVSLGMLSDQGDLGGVRAQFDAAVDGSNLTARQHGHCLELSLVPVRHEFSQFDKVDKVDKSERR